MAGKRIYLTTEDFLRGIVVEPEDMEVPGLGWIQVRGVTTLEMQRINAEANRDEMRMMTLAVKTGLVFPALPDSAIDELQRGAAGKVSAIATRIMELSGMGSTQEAMEAIEGEAGGSSSAANGEPQT